MLASQLVAAKRLVRRLMGDAMPSMTWPLDRVTTDPRWRQPWGWGPGWGWGGGPWGWGGVGFYGVPIYPYGFSPFRSGNCAVRVENDARRSRPNAYPPAGRRAAC